MRSLSKQWTSIIKRSKSIINCIEILIRCEFDSFFLSSLPLATCSGLLCCINIIDWTADRQQWYWWFHPTSVFIATNCETGDNWTKSSNQAPRASSIQANPEKYAPREVFISFNQIKVHMPIDTMATINKRLKYTHNHCLNLFFTLKLEFLVLS